MEKIFVVKVYQGETISLAEKRILRIRFYEDLRHALSDIIDRDSELLSDFEFNNVEFRKPEIKPLGGDDSGYNVDFVFYYSNGIAIEITEMITEESFRNESV